MKYFIFTLCFNLILFYSTDFNSYGPVSIAETTAQRRQGRLAAPVSPGLGVSPRLEVLGSPVFVYPPL